MLYHSCTPFIKKGRNKLIISSLWPSFVPEAGLEPARPEEHRILSPACLPIPPLGQHFSEIHPVFPGISILKNTKKKPSTGLRVLAGRLKAFWSERRDSNPRPRPWQGRALPAELLSHFYLFTVSYDRFFLRCRKYNRIR